MSKHMSVDAGCLVTPVKHATDATDGTHTHTRSHRLRSKMEADMAEVQLLENSVKWEVESSTDQNVFLQVR